ncbi:MAG: PilZ domain-containing protein [Terriglobia bacterium]|jgi:c-di-GMP-binding flagellar brake protein YcgR
MPPTLNPERRNTTRLPLVLPICLEWLSSDDEIHRTRGTTRDVSHNGVYCFLEGPLSPGLPVSFAIVFPSDLTGSDPLKLDCGGRIVRSEIRERRLGVAATIESARVSDASEPTPESERRTSVRIVPHQAIIVEYPGLRSVLRDLSPTGAFIEDDRPFPVGRTIRLHLCGGEISQPVEVEAIVRRVEPNVGMAVEFIAMTREVHAHLLRWVETSNAARPGFAHLTV